MAFAPGQQAGEVTAVIVRAVLNRAVMHTTIRPELEQQNSLHFAILNKERGNQHPIFALYKSEHQPQGKSLEGNSVASS